MEPSALKKEILAAAKSVEKDVIAWRRDIHAHPEIGFQEKRTGALVARELKRMGVKVRRAAETGVIGVIDCPSPVSTIAFRADMDALRMDEEGGLPFRSRTRGAAHMCGHDAHTAMLLGTAAVLVKLKSRLRCRVKLLFQPSEESSPSGAAALVKAGAMAGVDEVFGLHVGSMIASGTLFVRPGPMLAAADKIEIKIVGKGGHGASPHECVDPIPIAADAIAALQTVVSRKMNPIDSAVISICGIHAGTVFNIIPDEVQMIGTVRTLKDSVRRRMPGWIKGIVGGIARAHGATCEVIYHRDYPPVSNSPDSVARLRHAARELFGPKLKTQEADPIMGAEDFSFYLQKAKGAMAMLGAGGTRKSAMQPHHSPRFWIDESILYQGPALFAYLALMP